MLFPREDGTKQVNVFRDFVGQISAWVILAASVEF
jgi:hypothetical protein